MRVTARFILCVFSILSLHPFHWSGFVIFLLGSRRNACHKRPRMSTFPPATVTQPAKIYPLPIPWVHVSIQTTLSNSKLRCCAVYLNCLVSILLLGNFGTYQGKLNPAILPRQRYTGEIMFS